MEQYGLDKVIGDLKAKGVKAGEEEAAKIVAGAKAKAQEIVAEARQEAEATRREAADERNRTLAALEAETAHAARVGLSAFRRSVEEGFMMPEIEQSLKGVLQKPALLEQIVLEMVKGFVASGMQQSNLEVLLPQARQKELEALLVGKLGAQGTKGLKISYDEGFSYGLKIGPKDGSFKFDLSEEGFLELFVRFFSPRFRRAFYVEGAEGTKQQTDSSSGSAKSRTQQERA